MELEQPRFALREEVFAGRRHHADGVRFGGLWAAGNLSGLARYTVAVVGARAPSDAARERARQLGRALAEAGVCVLSGLALGIDGAAHAGALEGGGPTVGVLGGGHRHFFPERNRCLANAMLAGGGAVLSPYDPGEPARPGQFLQRNGVVAALADMVVIVEAAGRSGALNTASWAAALGIDVLAYPGDVERPKAAGCNALIRDGATLVRGTADVLAAIGLSSPVAERKPANQRFTLEGPAALLAADLGLALESGPASLEALVDRVSAPAGDVIGALVRLELAGYVERRDGRFARVSASGGT